MGRIRREKDSAKKCAENQTLKFVMNHKFANILFFYSGWRVCISTCRLLSNRELARITPLYHLLVGGLLLFRQNVRGKIEVDRFIWMWNCCKYKVLLFCKQSVFSQRSVTQSSVIQTEVGIIGETVAISTLRCTDNIFFDFDTVVKCEWNNICTIETKQKRQRRSKKRKIAKRNIDWNISMDC